MNGRNNLKQSLAAPRQPDNEPNPVCRHAPVERGQLTKEFEMPTTSKALLFAIMTVVAAPAALARDRDDNPPGPAGGPGTNWENPPGPAGGPGASRDLRHHHRWLQTQMTRAEWQAFMAMKAAERYAFCDKKRIPFDRCRYDRDDNPPGPAGGPGTNWENPPGPAGGPGASPDRR